MRCINNKNQGILEALITNPSWILVELPIMWIWV